MSRRRTILAGAVTVLLVGCGGPGPTPREAASATPTASPTRPAPSPPPTTTIAPPTVTPTTTARPIPEPSPTASPTPAPTMPGSIALEPFADGFGQLVLLTHAPGQLDAVFVVEQEGRVWQGGTDGAFLPQPYLDISDRVGFGGERGLLGLAFHPEYASNGRLFVNYTDPNDTTTVSEFARLDGCECADPASERVLLTIEQPFSNHNGGMVAFGADGHLYISSGDGGGADDPLRAGQDLTTLLGKILRIDVDAPSDGLAYGIPGDNPFAGGERGARREIWDWGLRNPWRLSFDRQTGDLFIGDVGQGTWEEVDAEPAGSGGRNYGWSVMEGPDCFESASCDRTGLTLPVAWYSTTGDHCAITGGYVYRGAAVPGLAGTYLFADYCTGTVWGIDAASAIAGQAQQPRVLNQSQLQVTGFGEDASGEVYLVTIEGEILRVAAAANPQ